MFNEEFTNYPGRAEMLELVRQRETQQCAPLDQRDTEEGVWAVCIFQPGAQS
jgi:hypothetical protein